jgi:helicase
LPFKGLFIGIDRYASPEINWLNCARRDARALHGLFIDSMGGESALLTDE